MTPTFVRKDASGWFGTVGDVQMQTYEIPAELPIMMERHQLERDFVKRSKPKTIITTTIVYEKAIVQLDQAKRDAVTANTRESAPFVRAGALVLIAPGFKAALIRGIVASLTLLTGAGYPFKVAAHEDEAFDWLAQYLDASMKRDDLRRGYDELRAPKK